LRSATELPSGVRSGPSREYQNDSVSSVASAGMATGCTITNWDHGRDPQLPSERPPIRSAYRPVRTIVAVVPVSWRSTRLTPPPAAPVPGRVAVLEAAVVQQLLGEGRSGCQRARAQGNAEEQTEEAGYDVPDPRRALPDLRAKTGIAPASALDASADRRNPRR